MSTLARLANVRMCAWRENPVPADGTLLLLVLRNDLPAAGEISRVAGC